jgi:hypothetical protein
MDAMIAGIHSTLGSSPKSIHLNRDMLLNIPLTADWQAIAQRLEHLKNENLVRKDQKNAIMTPSLNKGYLQKMETLHVRSEKQQTIQGSKDKCKQYVNNGVKTRHLRETPRKKN